MEHAEFEARVRAVEDRIEAARQRAGRSDAVTLLAVTKTHPPEAVHMAIAAGIRDVGENRVQELEQKVEAVGRSSARWHLIGHLQRNKVKAAIPLFDLLHSLDSERLAQRLSADATALGVEVRALVQVNVSGEGTKGGFGAEEAVDAVARMATLPGLVLEGMMTMAPFDVEEAELRRVFSGTRRLAEEAARQVEGFHLRHLSMGMSSDYEIAVEEGSTLVRVGSVLFGERE